MFPAHPEQQFTKCAETLAPLFGEISAQLHHVRNQPVWLAESRGAKAWEISAIRMLKIKSSGEPVKFPKVDGMVLFRIINEHTKDANWLYMAPENPSRI